MRLLAVQEVAVAAVAMTPYAKKEEEEEEEEEEEKGGYGLCR